MSSIRITRGRPSRILQVLLVVAMLATQAGVMLQRDNAPPAYAAQSIAQTHYTPFEAQAFIDQLRSITGDPACCNGPVNVSVSITSGADANTVVYDHYEDGYEADPFNPVQASTVTLTMDRGEVWSQTSSVPVDPRVAGDIYYDGRDKVISTAPIAMTQTGYADDPGTVHAGGVQVMDLDKSGTNFRVPVGEDADHNEVFEYVGLIIVGTANGTTVTIDADADGTPEAPVTVDEGEVYVVDGGVNLGATVSSDIEVSVYVASGDIGATYEGRFIELFPTRAWTDAYVSPVGARSSSDDDGTRVFVFNPGAAQITVDVVEGGGGTGQLLVPAGGQDSYVMPVDAGARFTSIGGSPFYALQAITTEGTSTSAFDWGFTLIPEAAATPAVIVPYAPGSGGLTNNYSPVWVAADAATDVYIDLDGDPATGGSTDPEGNQYDFLCPVAALESLTVYDDGTTTCYSPSDDATSGGDKDLTGARLYTVDGTRLSSAWGQRSNYTAGNPALDMGTTILPYPALLVSKTAVVTGDVDLDGKADPGDTITYTVTLVNEGIVDVDVVTIHDEVPANTTYIAGTTDLDGVPEADDTSPYSPFPADADSPAGHFTYGTIFAGETINFSYDMLIDDPLPIGVTTIDNLATVTSEYGTSTVITVVPLDLPFTIVKSSAPSASPVGSGDTISYTVQVFNGEDFTHTGVDVTDTLPAGTSYVAASVAADIDGTPVSASAPPNLITGETLDAGQVLTITFDVEAPAPLPAGITDFVNVAEATSDQQPDPVSDSTTDPADPWVDLSLTKTDGDTGVFRPGDAFTYTIDVTNSGPDVADNVVVVDTLPAGVTFDAAGSDPSCVEGPVGTITCSLGDVGVTSTSFDVAVVINAGVDGILTNEATVSSDSPEEYPGDETDYEDTPVDALPSLTVLKSAAPNSMPEPGGTVTFSIEVQNPTVETLTLTSLTDDVFGDLLDGSNPAVTSNTCPTQALAIAPGDSFGCTFDVDLTGNGGDPPHLDTVTAVVEDDEGNPATDTDSATVTFTDEVPTIDVTKTPSVSSVSEPGDTVTFTVEVSNTAIELVTLTALSDDVFGDLLDGSNPNVSSNTCAAAASASIAGGAVLTCTFDAFVSGDASGPDHVDTVTATVEDDESNSVSASDAATVSFDDVLPTMTVTKTPTPASVREPGGTVSFTVETTNTSVEDITVGSLTDDVFGDLLDITNPAVAFNDCPAQALTIASGGTLTCAFDAVLSGDSSDPDHVDTVTAIAADDEGNQVTESDSATVPFTDVVPTISVTKTPSAGSVPESGGTVTFIVVLDNTGVEEITVVSLIDDVFGDLLDPAYSGVANNTCAAAGLRISAGGTLTCTFDAELSGMADDPDHVDTVTATVMDDEGNEVSESDSATVGYSPVDTELSGHIFVDENNNAVQDAGELDLPDIDVMITDGSGNTFTVTSDADGDWAVQVRSGTATLSVLSYTVPHGHQLTTGNSLQFADVIPGIPTDSEDVGYRPGDATVRGAVWIDLDGDDTQDDREPVLQAVRVWVLDGNAAEVAQGMTDASGDYQIGGLRPGDYVLALDDATIPEGLEASWDAEGDADRRIAVTLGPAETVSDLDFAERGVGIIGDYVWIDDDRDGVADPDEDPLQGVAVALVWAGFDGEFDTDDDVDFGERASDADGAYEFVELPPGDYRVMADLSTAGIEMTATTELIVLRTLAAGTIEETVDYGFAAEEELPNTGFDVLRLLLIAGGLVIAGTTLVGGSILVESRRRLSLRAALQRTRT